MSDSVIRIVNARQNNLQGITVELPAPGAHRHHRAVRLREEHARVRHPLRRRPAALHRVAVDLRQAVPRADAQAAGRPARGHRALRGDRAAQPHRLQPVHRRHRHRGLRLPPAALGPRRAELLPRLRCAGPTRHAPERGRRRPRRRARWTAAGRPSRCPPSPGSRTTRWWKISARSASSACIADGAPHHLDELPAELDLTRADELLVVVDRLAAEPAAAGRLAESIATAFQEGEGVAVVLHPALGSGRDRLRFTRFPACSACDTPAAMVTPALFSFNNPRGACPQCNGFGAVLEYDESLMVPDPARSLAEGAIDPWTKPRYESRRRIAARLRPRPRGRRRQAVAQAQGGPPPGAALRTEGPLRRHLPLPQGPRGEALQAVHPGLPAAVPARQDLRRLRRHPAQPRRARRPDRRRHHRRRGAHARWTASTTGSQRSR